MRFLGFISTFDKQVFAFGSTANYIAGTSNNALFSNFYCVEHFNGVGIRLVSQGYLKFTYMLVTETNDLYIVDSYSLQQVKLPTSSIVTQIGYYTHGIVATGIKCHY
jgi:hypothetical protein